MNYLLLTTYYLRLSTYDFLLSTLYLLLATYDLRLLTLQETRKSAQRMRKNLHSLFSEIPAVSGLSSKNGNKKISVKKDQIVATQNVMRTKKL
jgi:hypothetical protein